MTKRRFSFFFASIFVGLLLLAGCDAGAKKEAANFVRGYYQGWIDGTLSAEASYDDFISQTSKELLGLSKDEYVQNFNAAMEDLNVKYTEASVVGEEKMDTVGDTKTEIYRIRRTLKTASNAGENKETGYDYVIKENGQMRFLQYGAYAKADYPVPMEKPSALNITMPAIYTGVDSLILRLEVKNSSSTNYAIGYMGNGQITVTTDKGEYTQEMSVPPQTLMMSTGVRSGEFVINNAKGNVQKVVINNVYALGENLRPANVHNSFSITVYDKADQ